MTNNKEWKEVTTQETPNYDEEATIELPSFKEITQSGAKKGFMYGILFGLAAGLIIYLISIVIVTATR